MGVKSLNKAIKFAPYGRRALVPRAVYDGRYVFVKDVMCPKI
jgi:hypothetical protein